MPIPAAHADSFVYWLNNWLDSDSGRDKDIERSRDSFGRMALGGRKEHTFDDLSATR